MPMVHLPERPVDGGPAEPRAPLRATNERLRWRARDARSGRRPSAPTARCPVAHRLGTASVPRDRVGGAPSSSEAAVRSVEPPATAPAGKARDAVLVAAQTRHVTAEREMTALNHSRSHPVRHRPISNSDTRDKQDLCPVPARDVPARMSVRAFSTSSRAAACGRRRRRLRAAATRPSSPAPIEHDDRSWTRSKRHAGACQHRFGQEPPAPRGGPCRSASLRPFRVRRCRACGVSGVAPLA
jgi:hypothetical protein